MNTIDKVLDLYHINDISDCRIDYETITQIAKEFSMLQTEKMILQQRISRAVELGKNQLFSNSNYTGYTDEMCLKDLLDILRGEK